MYQQKNGILYKDGEPRIMLGTSYYPSFHKSKYPVPPDGDRLGEMVKDVHAMQAFGLNQVRLAALGELSLGEDGRVLYDGSFIDRTVAEIAEVGMTSSLRLQGYVTNLRGNRDYLMINHLGEPMEGHWAAFMTASLFHEGINRDTDDATAALASHFAAMPGVLSLQTYNEPHYPFNGVFDYHPDTIRAYRAWCAEEGLPVADPPRRRPLPGEDDGDWITWRLFSMRAMGDYLTNAARLAKTVSGLEGYTCATSNLLTPTVMDGGVSYFDLAEGMDVLGITTYVHVEGADYYAATYIYDLAESAAATFGRHAWTVEADARVNMPGRKCREYVYAILGAGHKGINFYEWRGDYPGEGTPRPDNCGILHNDGRHACHYDDTREMVAFVNRHSSLFAAAERHREGLGILWSAHALAKADAARGEGHNAAVDESVFAYREARRLGFSVDFARAEDLSRNPLGIRVLLIPHRLEMLSPGELREIAAFVQSGGRVYHKRNNVCFSGYTVGGYWEFGREVKEIATSHFASNYEIADIAEENGLAPFAVCDMPSVHAATLEGEGYYIVTLVNSSAVQAPAENVRLKLRGSFRRAEWLTSEGTEPCRMENGEIVIPMLDAGAAVWLEKDDSLN